MDKTFKNLDVLERRVGKAEKIAKKGDGMKLPDAMKLGRKSNSICSTIKKTMTTYDGVTPTDAEAKKVLDQMTKIIGMTESQLDAIVQNKATYEKLHVGGLVKRNVTKTSAASAEFEKILLSKAPAPMKPEAEALAARREKAFAKAISAFSSSTGGEEKADEEDDSD